ncbi:hypothetical protein ACTFIU_007813 [Dictyostelium citrinum]
MDRSNSSSNSSNSTEIRESIKDQILDKPIVIHIELFYNFKAVVSSILVLPSSPQGSKLFNYTINASYCIVEMYQPWNPYDRFILLLINTNTTSFKTFKGLDPFFHFNLYQQYNDNKN